MHVQQAVVKAMRKLEGTLAFVVRWRKSFAQRGGWG